MKLKWRNLPAIVTLLAGFIVCIITIRCRYPLNKMLWILIAVMFIFFIISLIMREVLVFFFKDKEEEKDEENDEENLEDEELEGEMEEKEPDEDMADMGQN